MVGISEYAIRAHLQECLAAVADQTGLAGWEIAVIATGAISATALAALCGHFLCYNGANRLSLASRRFVFSLALRVRQFFGPRFGGLIDEAIRRYAPAMAEHAAAGERVAERHQPADVVAQDQEAQAHFLSELSSPTPATTPSTTETSFSECTSHPASNHGFDDSGVSEDYRSRNSGIDPLDSVLVWVSVLLFFFILTLTGKVS